jgi:pentatricopeptide repeat protein
MPRPPPTQAGTLANATFSHLFQLCANGGRAFLAAGRAAHARMLVSGFVPTAFVANCLLQMYSRCAGAAPARRVFDAMPHRDTVSWNTMLTAYSHVGGIDAALALFEEIPDPDVVSWNTLVSSYCQRSMFRESVGLYLQMVRRGVAPD